MAPSQWQRTGWIFIDRIGVKGMQWAMGDDEVLGVTGRKSDSPNSHQRF